VAVLGSDGDLLAAVCSEHAHDVGDRQVRTVGLTGLSRVADRKDGIRMPKSA
jgi:hypothetical protein